MTDAAAVLGTPPTRHTPHDLRAERFRLQAKRFEKRSARSQRMKFFAFLSTAFGLFWLAWILETLLTNGASALSLTLFTAETPPPGETGGLKNAIFGSLLLAGAGTAAGTPVGILTGIYLSEYGRNSRFSAAVRFLNDILLSAPSIVLGLFIYTVLVAPFGHFSGWAGAAALALIVIPVVTRTTDNLLQMIPDTLREAAVALGCPKYLMVSKILCRAARSGIVTGVLLSVARISGETAPLLFTSLSNQFTNWDMSGPVSSLPCVIYQFAASPFDSWKTLAWAGALLITLFILAVSVLTRCCFREEKH